MRALFHFLLLVTPLSTVLADGSVCGQCYPSGSLTVLEKPSLGDEHKLCDLPEKVIERALAEKCEYLKLAEFYGVPQGATPLIQLDSKTHYVVHLLRIAAGTDQSRYYGEFIDRTLTEVGGSQKDLSLILDAEPATKVKDPLQLSYFYIVEDYQWSAERVTGLSRKYQRVRLTSEGKTEPLGETTEVKGLRNLARITIEQDTPNGNGGSSASSSAVVSAGGDVANMDIANQQVEVSLYYEDPLFTVPRFFRSFPLLTDKQRTVLQFIADQQGNFRPAILRVHRGEVDYGQIRVRPTGEDEISLAVRLR